MEVDVPGDAPSFVVSHELPLDQAPDGYQHFDARDNGWTKVVLAPAARLAAPGDSRRRGGQRLYLYQREVPRPDQREVPRPAVGEQPWP